MSLLLSSGTPIKAFRSKNVKTDQGYQFSFSPKVIVDYKTLTFFLVKKDEEDFLLGGRGVSMEFCFTCNAVRVCMLAMQF